jgi:RNA polymerase sigma-70 factor (ECF subfamily)
MPAEAVAARTAGLTVGATGTRYAPGGGSPAGSPAGIESRHRGSMASQSLGRGNDAELIREAQRGSRAAFEELVRQYDRPVLRLALHLTGSEQDAQDIYQEAFLKAYRHLGNFRFECSFYTWLYRIVTNLCLDHLRKRRTRREDSPVGIDKTGEEFDLLQNFSDERAGANPEHDLMTRELGKNIVKALEKLSPRERMVFELKHYQGLRLRAIGEMLDTTEETAKNTLFRATQKLRIALAGAR